VEALRGQDRRRHVRLYEAFPVYIRGIDTAYQAFESRTVLDNLSASGFFVRLPQCPGQGARVFAVVEFASGNVTQPHKLRIAVRARVVRIECWSDGQWGVGVVFTSHRFLPRAMFSLNREGQPQCSTPHQAAAFPWSSQPIIYREK
jgi:hypothetical protein